MHIFFGGWIPGSVWLINVGYSLQLVPMIIRVSTIINVVQASRKMKIVKVNMQKLLVRSIGITAIMALYCMFWTIFDPPQSQASIQVTNDRNEFGETELSVSNHCDSKANLWYLVSFISQAMLLLCGSVLARQMRSVPDVSVLVMCCETVYCYSCFMTCVLTGYTICACTKVGQ